jgi:GGDEF domain-containing protein
MDSVAVAFWGAYFGAVTLSLGAALLAFRRSARRVATTGALSAFMSGAYVAVFLNWLSLPSPDAQLRLQAHLAALCAGVLGMLLFWLLGLFRDRHRSMNTAAAVAAMTFATLVAGWLLDPPGALALGVALQVVLIGLGLAGGLRSARAGSRLGWLAVAGVACMSVAIAGLTWHALDPASAGWPVHAVSAVAAVAYLGCMAAAMWAQYAYLIDVREAMVHGPGFDPVTRLRSPVETDLMAGDAFARNRSEGRPLGVILVSISNLQALEHLHGRAAYNHGLFICASRLRRLVSPGVEIGRVGDDGFLLLVRRPAGADALIELAQQAAQRLARPVALGTSQDLSALEAKRTIWVADVGVGVLVAPAEMKPTLAIAGARAMSRTAWSYASRVAFFDEDNRQIAELVPTAAR